MVDDMPRLIGGASVLDAVSEQQVPLGPQRGQKVRSDGLVSSAFHENVALWQLLKQSFR